MTLALRKRGDHAAEAARGGLLPTRPAFDALLIFGTLAIALACGAVASLSTAVLVAVVWVDIWLFANPHVIATFTRIGAPAADVRRHWFLVFVLPAIVLAGVLVTALAWEVAGLFTLYFVAQTWHVTRQSFGIARAYRRTPTGALQPDRLAEVLIYLFPAWGLLARCAQAPEAFLGYPIHLPAVPSLAVDAVGLAAVACGAWWVLRQARAALVGRIDWRHDGFVASHLGVSLVACLWIDDITVGWVVVNVWHNVQYLLFVWVQNLRRDERTQAELSELGGRAARYAGVCLVLGAALYLAVDWAGAQLLWLGLPTVLIAHFTFNFHHYLVDGVIWKRRRPSRAQRVPRDGVHAKHNDIRTQH